MTRWDDILKKTFYLQNEAILWRINLLSEKQTHFAVIKGGEITYKEIFRLFLTFGTKFCSEIVYTIF